MSARVTGIHQSLGVVYPVHDIVVNGNLAVHNPGLGHIVGISAVCIHGRGHDLVTLVGNGLGSSIKGCPIFHVLLNGGGIIAAKHFLGGLAVVEQNAGAALPGKSLQNAVGIRHHILGVLILVGNIRVGDAQILNRHGITGINILQCVIRLDQEHVDLVVGRRAVLLQQRFVQVVLIGIAFIGSLMPDYGHIADGTVGLVSLGITGIKVYHPLSELVVPAVNVQHLAFLGPCAHILISALVAARRGL